MEKKETFGFKSTRPAPSVPELREFKEGLFDLISNIKFRNCKVDNDLQAQLKRDVSLIKAETDMIIAADKTSNHYKLSVDKYNDLLGKAVQKEYKKSNKETFEVVCMEDKALVEKLEIDDRVFQTEKQQCFITLKDHKDNFESNPKTRLINPTKSEMGKIAKHIVSRIVLDVKKKTGLGQWTKTSDAVEYFENIKEKERASFIQADISNFYANINEKLLGDALDWAEGLAEIENQDREIIMQSCKSFLIERGNIWVKKGNSLFDVTMGAYMGAELSEIVGLFILWKLDEMIRSKHSGQAKVNLYRDDLGGHSYLRARQNEKLAKDVREVFALLGLSITIQVNMNIMDFLDVKFNLADSTFQPYNKPNNVPCYVHVSSNHPKSVLKAIGEGVNKRLNSISSSEVMFNNNKEIYQKALQDAGHGYKLHYVNKEEVAKNVGKRSRNRKRKVTWFNPPWSNNVKTNVGKAFLSLIDKLFPKGSLLHKIINRNTVKVSYSTCSNMKKILARHNMKVAEKSSELEGEQRKTCNCRAGTDSCPLQGNCLVSSVVYGAAVTAETADIPARPADHVGWHTTDWAVQGGIHAPRPRPSSAPPQPRPGPAWRQGGNLRTVDPTGQAAASAAGGPDSNGAAATQPTGPAPAPAPTPAPVIPTARGERAARRALQADSETGNTASTVVPVLSSAVSDPNPSGEEGAAEQEGEEEEEESVTVVGTYCGQTGGTFKARYNGHTGNMRRDTHGDRTASRLAECVWDLKDQNIEHDVNWSILGRARGYSSTTGVCNLCTLEKLTIIKKPQLASVNRRQELFNHCVHMRSRLMSAPLKKKGVG